MRLTPEYGATFGPYEKGHQSCTNDGQLAGLNDDGGDPTVNETHTQ